jgi:ribosomal protein S18 acetylase RimI-like enzyme
MEPIAFRRASVPDEAALFDLFCRVRTRDLEAASWDDRVRAATLRLQFDAQRRGYLQQWPAAETRLVLVSGAIAGCVIVDLAGGALHLLDIAVAPESRGQGIGGRIVRALQEEAAQAGQVLTLTVLRTNLPAVRLYSRLDFQVVRAGETQLVLEWRPPAAVPAATVLWSPDDFRALLDTWIDVVHDGGAVPLLLKEVQERSGGGMVRFSLLLHGPGDRPLEQGTYTFRHPTRGDVDLFTVPVAGSSAERMLYEICFSRPAQAAPAR